MSEEAFKELIASVDALDFKWDFEYSKALDRLYADNEASLTDDQKKILGWEVILFRLTTKNRFEEPSVERFAPVVVYKDGSIFPDPDAFDEEALNYFRGRIDETKHPILKARYLDIVWEKGGKENRFNIGKQLVKAYIEAFRFYSHDNEIERIDNLYRALEIAMALEKKDEHELTELAINEIREYINNLKTTENYRWLMDAVEILVKKAQISDKEELEKYYGYIQDAINYYLDDNNFFIQESLLTLKQELATKIDPSRYSKESLAEDKAQALIKEAEKRTDSLFVQQKFYSDAAQIYRNAGLVDKADDMVAKVREIGQSPEYEKQFQSFSHEVAIPNEEIEKWKRALGSGKELPIIMGLSKNFLPDWESAVKLAEELGKKYIAQKLFTKTTIGEQGYPVSVSITDEDYIYEQFHIQASFAHSFLVSFLREKIENKEVSYSDFTHLLKKIRKIDEDTYQSVRKGLRSFFRRDFYEATLILTTQLEDLLRKFMPFFGLNPTRQNPKIPMAFQEKPLDAILKEMKPYLGDNIYHNYIYVLSENRHYNLRHNVAHGFLKSSDNNEANSTIVLQLYCSLMARFDIKQTKISPDNP